jgi:hypothetical protein
LIGGLIRFVPAHLIRPTLAYFKEEAGFDGISFSTTVHIAGKMPAASKTEAVEFFLPFAALRCYENYDCTGQQLIDTGAVLINGERVALDLQIAEGGPARRKVWTLTRRSTERRLLESDPLDSLQRLANSLQAFAEHFGVHSHADAEMVGQTEKPAGHG